MFGKMTAGVLFWPQLLEGQWIPGTRGVYELASS